MKVGGGNMNLWSGKRSLILALVIWLAPSVGSCSLKTCKSVAWNEIISLIIWDSSPSCSCRSREKQTSQWKVPERTPSLWLAAVSHWTEISDACPALRLHPLPLQTEKLLKSRQMEEKLSGSEPTFFHRNTQSEERKLVAVVRVVHVID